MFLDLQSTNCPSHLILDYCINSAAVEFNLIIAYQTQSCLLHPPLRRFLLVHPLLHFQFPVTQSLQLQFKFNFLEYLNDSSRETYKHYIKEYSMFMFIG